MARCPTITIDRNLLVQFNHELNWRDKIKINKSNGRFTKGFYYISFQYACNHVYHAYLAKGGWQSSATYYETEKEARDMVVCTPMPNSKYEKIPFSICKPQFIVKNAWSKD